MRSISLRTIPNITHIYFPSNSDVRESAYHHRDHAPKTETESYPVFEKLASEGGENFFNYIKWLGLSKDQNLIVLSCSHHYFYDTEDLKDIKTVVSLKLLNQIRQIKDFLHNIYNILPDKCNFIGSFIDGKSYTEFLSHPNMSNSYIAGKSDPFENGIETRFPFLNMIYHFMDSRTDRFITKSTATMLLEEEGLTVSDISEINGITYFCTRKEKYTSE
jgi:hypothetical protein